MSAHVQGYCPMGCGQTLFLGSGGYITCSLNVCPNPTAVSDILEDAEHEHVVTLEAEDFTIKHPLRERLNDDLPTCSLHTNVAGLAGPPRKLGRYRVRFVERRGWVWEPLRCSGSGQGAEHVLPDSGALVCTRCGGAFLSSGFVLPDHDQPQR